MLNLILKRCTEFNDIYDLFRLHNKHSDDLISIEISYTRNVDV